MVNCNQAGKTRQNLRANRLGNTIGKIKASVLIDEMNVGLDKNT